jgi:hypothetical protein
MKTPAELKELNYFAGTWRLEADLEPSALGTGGKVLETDRNEWMDGGFFLIVRSQFTTPTGSGTGFAFKGYDPNAGIYTYDEFNSMGDAIHSKGELAGNTWTWSGERKTDKATTRTRWIVNVTSPVAYDFRFETSPDGESWSVIMKGKAAKQK